MGEGRCRLARAHRRRLELHQLTVQLLVQGGQVVGQAGAAKQLAEEEVGEPGRHQHTVVHGRAHQLALEPEVGQVVAGCDARRWVGVQLALLGRLPRCM